MPEARIEIETNVCAHCNASINRVPFEGTSDNGPPVWRWRWVHHNTLISPCDCHLERARPSMAEAHP